MPSVRVFNALSLRSYLLRLPLFTRVILAVILFFWVLGVQSVWDLRQWGALIPDQINFATGQSPSPASIGS